MERKSVFNRTGTALLCFLLIMTGGAPSGAAVSSPPPIRHVFLVVLENQSFARTFGRDSPAPYLGAELPAKGALLVDYFAIGHNSLGNYIAMISGQAPNEHTQGDCVTFSEFRLRQPALDAHGQALGIGCIYPKMVMTLPDQLERAGLTWKGYMEDMGKDPRRESATCGHSTPGAPEKLLEATARDQYAVKHNPFVYFHSIIDDQARCDAHVVNLERLTQDLRRIDSTPNFVFITPNLCSDGHDAPCVDGASGGLRSIDAFLRTWIPRILDSPAFRQDGLLIVTFDESDRDSRACCGHTRRCRVRDCRRGSTAPVAASSARCCCRRSSRPARARRSRTTTTRCCARWKISSASRISVLRPIRRPDRSVQTSSLPRAHA